MDVMRRKQNKKYAVGIFVSPNEGGNWTHFQNAVISTKFNRTTLNAASYNPSPNDGLCDAFGG